MLKDTCSSSKQLGVVCVGKALLPLPPIVVTRYNLLASIAFAYAPLSFVSRLFPQITPPIFLVLTTSSRNRDCLSGIVGITRYAPARTLTESLSYTFLRGLLNKLLHTILTCPTEPQESKTISCSTSSQSFLLHHFFCHRLQSAPLSHQENNK